MNIFNCARFWSFFQWFIVISQILMFIWIYAIYKWVKHIASKIENLKQL